MNRRQALVGTGLAVVPLTGCLSDDTDSPVAGEDTLADRFDCDGASRPLCEIEAGIETEWTAANETHIYESIGTEQYPEPPSELTEESAVAFAKAHETVYERNDYLCDRSNPEQITGYDVTFDETWTLDRYDGIFVIRLQYWLTPTGIDEEGGPWETADGYGGAVYGVDETGVVRLPLTGLSTTNTGPAPEDTPDPVTEGELLTCF